MIPSTKRTTGYFAGRRSTVTNVEILLLRDMLRITGPSANPVILLPRFMWILKNNFGSFFIWVVPDRYTDFTVSKRLPLGAISDNISFLKRKKQKKKEKESFFEKRILEKALFYWNCKECEDFEKEKNPYVFLSNKSFTVFLN